MSNMRSYYVSRFAVAVGFGFLFYLVGGSWWQGVLAGGAAVAWFLWAPHSGRYQVTPELGVTALRRDERSQWINDAAGRNAFVGVMLAAGAIAVYVRSVGMAQVPIRALDWLLILGGLLYFGSDFLLRRRT